MSLDTMTLALAKAYTDQHGGGNGYIKPDSGIPKSDLSNEVQTSLSKADTALQEHQDISGKVDKVQGKGLSTNDYTNADKSKVDAIPENPKYTDTVYDDTDIKNRLSTIENKEDTWDNKQDKLTPKVDYVVPEQIANFITKSVNDLENYYTKSQTYTQDEVNLLVDSIPKFAISVVSSLPTSNISSTTIYLLKENEDSGNLYTEYIYINNNWEILGSQKVDLTGYATETWVESKGYLTQHQSLSAYRTSADQDIIDNSKQNAITETNKLPYSLLSDAPNIPSTASDIGITEYTAAEIDELWDSI